VALATRIDNVVVGVALAIACAIGWAVPYVLWYRLEHARPGVERTIATESAALAFHATLFATVTYALFEEFASAPHLSMYVPFAFGTLVWTVTWTVTRRGLT